jgi:hypothetical protein
VFLPNKEFNILIVGLQKILSLLEAEDADVRIHAVKVVANLAAEGVCISLHYYLSYHQLILHCPVIICLHDGLMYLPNVQFVVILFAPIFA